MVKTLARLGLALAVAVPLLGAAPLVVAAEETPSAVTAEETPSSAVTAEEAQSVDAVMAEARALLDARRFDEALALLRPLTATDQIYADVVFLFGLAAIEASRLRSEEAEREALLDEAIAALHTMLTVRPDLARVRLELARAFFYKEEDGLARRHFERVLAGDVPDAVKANVRRFLAQIRARRRWTAYLGASLVPDTNIGGASDDEIIYIEVFGTELPFRRNEQDLQTSGVGVSVWTGAGYEHPVTDRLRLRSGVDVSVKDHAGGRFDDAYLAVHAGPRWFVDARTELSVLANASRRWAGGSVDHNAAGARIETRRRLTDRVWANVHASWLDRDYRGGTRQDGPVVDLVLSGTWRLGPTVSANSAFGYSEQRPHDSQFENRSRRVRVGFNAALPRGFSLGGNAQVRWTDYPDHRFVRNSQHGLRKDRTQTLSASLYKRDLTVYGFSPQLVVTHEQRNSNEQGLDFVGNRAELRLVRQF